MSKIMIPVPILDDQQDHAAITLEKEQNHDEDILGNEQDHASNMQDY
jgi:hypothetical protein